ncbi:MAG: glycosyltransferase family 2 protein [bacterium]|nr:glycosyltransferase family 2 protein [bacterium]
MNISVVIIAKNEEEKIADCVISAKFAKEVIVVIDTESTDKTAEIAHSLGATVISNPWEGYGKQKNFGMRRASQNWILFLDADERVSTELQEAINSMLDNPEHGVYWVTIEDIFLGKRMKHLIGHNPRFVKKGAAQWSDKKVHEQMIYTGGTIAVYKDSISGELDLPIIHQSYATISDYVKKMHVYTTLDAQDMQKNNTHRSGRKVNRSFMLPYALAFRQAIKLLFYKKGILDGWPGITWSFLSAYYEFEMGQKYNAL